MKFKELERKTGVTFPRKWQEIYQTGAMNWLELSKKEFSAKRKGYIDDPDSFMMFNCDCELFLFDEISKQIQKLNRWIKEQEQDEESTFDKQFTLIPFGQSAAGDLYCFLYKNKKTSAPKVILYMHDEYGDPDIIGENFEEFLYVKMLSSAAYEEDMQGQHWQNHLQWLLESDRKKIENKSAEELTTIYDELVYKQAPIWIPSAPHNQAEPNSSIFARNNREYALKLKFYHAKDFRTIIFQNTKYQVIGEYETEEQLVCVAENQQLYLITKYNNHIYYIAPNLKMFQQEILSFEKLTKESALIDEIPPTAEEDADDILQEISDTLKKDILKIDSNAFDDAENFWSEICIEIEDRIIFM